MSPIHINEKTGISIAICCHNSANRLPETLQHLQNQILDTHCPWEVMIINNGSTDGTINISQSVWQRNPIAPLKIINEPKLGLTYAREAARLQAQYDIIGFIDDDNWINPNWIKQVLYNFHTYPEIAACGGPIRPIYETPPPDWFKNYAGNYTLWDLHEKAQNIQHPLCGAGLAIRKSAWDHLISSGFNPILSDRKGKSLSSGGDFELGYAFLLAGYPLWYDPKLHIQHFIPQSRMHWAYLIKLREGFGRQSTVLEIYTQLLQNINKEKQKKYHSWILETLKCCYHLIRHSPHGFFPQYFNYEGEHNAALWAEQWGRLSSLLQERSFYDKRYNELASSQWVLSN